MSFTQWRGLQGADRRAVGYTARAGKGRGVTLPAIRRHWLTCKRAVREEARWGICVEDLSYSTDGSVDHGR